MTQYRDLVQKRKVMIEAEQWGESISCHEYQKDVGYYITYNSGKVIKVEGKKKTIIKMPDSVEELIDNYLRSKA